MPKISTSIFTVNFLFIVQEEKNHFFVISNHILHFCCLLFTECVIIFSHFIVILNFESCKTLIAVIFTQETHILVREKGKSNVNEWNYYEGNEFQLTLFLECMQFEWALNSLEQNQHSEFLKHNTKSAIKTFSLFQYTINGFNIHQ